ncbi:MAG: EAL domain-containing protein, partial [Thermoanaerobaculales bacterium]|nr:EAL domain-containing protein [Thermoanaerobaculales bacterium]
RETGVYPRFEEPVELQVHRKDGATRWVAVTNGHLQIGDQVAGIGTAVDISQRKIVKQALTRRLELENALTDISRNFLALPPEKLRNGIEYALEKLNEAARSDCTFLVLLAPDEETVTAEFRYHEGQGSKGDPRNCVIGDFGISRADLLLGEVLTLSGEDGEKAAQACCCDSAYRKRSSSLMPLLAGERLLGVLGHVWIGETPSADADNLRVLSVGAEILSSAIHRLSTELELQRNRERFELAQKAGRSVAWEWDPATDQMFMFESAAAVFGYDPEVIPATGTEMQSRILPEDRQTVAEAIRHSLKTGDHYSVEHRFLMPDNETVMWISARGQPILGDDGRVVKVMGVSADITDRRSAEAALNEERERAEVTLSSIGDGVIRTDLSGRIEYLNPAAERLIGWTHDEVQGRPLSEVYRIVEDGTRRTHRDLVAECIDRNSSIASPEWRCLFHRNGQEFAVRESASPIRHTDGKIIGAVLVVKDVTRVRGLEREMAFQTSHDTLTGLLNRQEFEERAKEALTNASFTGRRHALCYLDLDAFKVVNDTCGHSVGDLMLQQLAGILEATARGTDILARLGGDEFGLLLTDCSLDQARERADTFLDAVRAFRFMWKDKIFEVGVSIGIVPLDQESPTYVELLAAADAACFVAKEHGRNRVHISRPNDQQVASRFHETQWVQRLTRAVDEDHFLLYGQPIIPLQDKDSPEILEILLRLKDEKDIISPGRFIPAAERYRMMPVLDQWVIRNAFKALHQLVQNEPQNRRIFAINLSGQSLADTSVLDTIFEEFERTGIDPARLCFEITETAAISNLVAAQAFIGVLRERGCTFALDDFGSGLSSFRYLKELPVNYLKIDGSLVRDVDSDKVQREMVDAIRRVGKVMNLLTIGEWVEDQNTLRALQKIGVDYVQGYAVGYPMPLELSLT